MSHTSVPLRILLVEDNQALAMVLRRVVTARGYPCAVAHSLGKALEALEMNTFDVVVTDLHLGAESGVRVLEAASKLVPKARRVLMSGSSGPRETSSLAHVTLQKPVAAETLMESIDPAAGDATRLRHND